MKYSKTKILKSLLFFSAPVLASTVIFVPIYLTKKTSTNTDSSKLDSYKELSEKYILDTAHSVKNDDFLHDFNIYKKIMDHSQKYYEKIKNFNSIDNINNHMDSYINEFKEMKVQYYNSLGQGKIIQDIIDNITEIPKLKNNNFKNKLPSDITKSDFEFLNNNKNLFFKILQLTPDNNGNLELSIEVNSDITKTKPHTYKTKISGFATVNNLQLKLNKIKNSTHSSHLTLKQNYAFTKYTNKEILDFINVNNGLDTFGLDSEIISSSASTDLTKYTIIVEYKIPGTQTIINKTFVVEGFRDKDNIDIDIEIAGFESGKTATLNSKISNTSNQFVELQKGDSYLGIFEKTTNDSNLHISYKPQNIESDGHYLIMFEFEKNKVVKFAQIYVYVYGLGEGNSSPKVTQEEIDNLINKKPLTSHILKYKTWKDVTPDDFSLSPDDLKTLGSKITILNPTNPKDGCVEIEVSILPPAGSSGLILRKYNVLYPIAKNNDISKKILYFNIKNEDKYPGYQFPLDDKPKEIFANTFSGETLDETFKIPESITKIHKGAFTNSTLNKDFIIPNSVKIIEDGAFKDATISRGFYVEKDIKVNPSAFQGIIFPSDYLILDNKAEISEDKTMIGSGYSVNEAATQRSVNFMNYNSAYRNINDWDFIVYKNSRIDKFYPKMFDAIVLPDDFVIPNYIHKIGEYSFFNAIINENFSFNNTKSIGYWAFEKAAYLGNTPIPNIPAPDNAFAGYRFSDSSKAWLAPDGTKYTEEELYNYYTKHTRPDLFPKFGWKIVNK